MIEKYGLFDSLEGDEREYAEADLALLIRTLGRDGVRGGSGALKVSVAASGLAVNVAAGTAIVQGRYYALEDDGSGVKTLRLTAATANPRIDRIVLTLNFAQRTVTLGVLEGKEAASPQAPALTRSTAVYMLSLAQVRVGVGAASLSASSITDERANETLCGMCVASADTALATAQTAASNAAAAAASAKSASDAAAKAQSTANTAQSTANSASTLASGKISKVSGATKNHIPVFDSSGSLTSSGVDMSGFTRTKMTLSGTTLTITTVS